jgi:heme exporter protein B
MGMPGCGEGCPAAAEEGGYERRGERRRNDVNALDGLRCIAAVFYKDVAAELRSKDVLSTTVVFALIVLVVFSLALDMRSGALAADVAPAVLWVTLSFTAMLGLGRSFAGEVDRGCMDGLLLCPVDRSLIYLGKMLAHFSFMVAMEGIVVPVYVLFFGVNLAAPDIVPLIAILVGGTLGLSALGTLFSAVAVHTRAREVMLSILMLPALVPLLMALVHSTGAVLDGLSLGMWGRLIAAYDAIVLAVSYAVFDFVVGE